MNKANYIKGTQLRIKGVILALLMAGSTGAFIPIRADAAPAAPYSVTTLASLPAGYGRITAQVNLRTGPSTDSGIIAKLHAGDKVKVIRKTSRLWVQVEFNGARGYVSSKYLSAEAAPAPKPASTSHVYGKTTRRVNLRSSAGSSSTVLSSLSAGTRVRVLKKYDNQWFLVDYNGRKGYLSDSYLTVEGQANVGHITTRTSLYASASYNSPLMAMSTGDIFTIVARTSAKWTKVNHNGQTGYIPNMYWASLGQNVPVLSRLNESRITSKSLLLVNLTDNKVILNRNGSTPVLPASLNKLFTIRYALTLMDRFDQVKVTRSALDLAHVNGSSAGLTPGTYYVNNLLAAMLVPSGNDAAYALAAYGGRKLLGPGHSTKAYVDAFMSGLRAYLKRNGYTVSQPTDASGDSSADRSTAWEVYRVANDLMKYGWFLDMVKTESYTTILPNGTSLTWRNSNRCLRTDHEFYDPSVTGLKTGSYFAINNLASVFRSNGKDYIMVSLGSTVTDGRYKDRILLKNLIKKQQ